MIVSPNSGIDLHTGAFLLSFGLVILLVTYLIEDRVTFSSGLWTMFGFLMGIFTSFFGAYILFACLAMKFFA